VLGTDHNDITDYHIKDNLVIWSYDPGTPSEQIYVYNLNTDSKQSISATGGSYTQLTSHGAVWVGAAPNDHFQTMYYDFKTKLTKPILEGVGGSWLWGAGPEDQLVFSGEDGLYIWKIS
jgi:hypothetical protein